MRRVGCIQYFIVAFFFVLPSIAFGACGDGITGGAGTVGDPYQINDATELASVSNCLGAGNSGKYFKVMNDIDLNVAPYNTGSGFAPIGNSSSNSFYGKFDGDYKTISNLFIYLPSTNYVGLFGHTSAGSIVEKVALMNVNVNGGSYAIGSLVGYVSGTVRYSSVYGGTVTGLMRLGGLVGQNSGTLQYSFASTTVTQKAAAGDCCVGGLLGGSENGGITNNSYSRGPVIHTSGGQGAFGGCIGNTNLSGAISYIYSTGPVYSLSTNPSNFEGLIGTSYVLSTNSYWDTQTSGRPTSASGTGKTTVQMKDQSTYSGWNFDTIWTIDPNFNEGYPYLQWQAVPPSSAPSTQVSNLAFSSVNYNQMTLSWANGNGNKRVVFAKQANTGTTTPVDNTVYSANSIFGSGSQVGSTGWYTVYNGTGSSVTVTGLSASTDYIFQVFEYNGSGPYALYLNNYADVNYATQASSALLAPTTQTTDITLSSVSNVQMTIGWTSGNGEKRVVFVKQDSTGVAIPVNNTTYSANTVFGSGTQIGSTGWYTVYNGTGSSVTVTGLSASTAYRVQVFEYNGGAGTELYFADTATNNPKNQTTAVAPSEITLGSGTSVTGSSEASPINIWYRSTHGQSVYTASELNTAGITGSTQITKVGFYVNSAPIRGLPNFIIRMKHTTDSNVASWQSSTGMTTVFSTTTYTPTAGGFDSLTLNTPFTWNGVDNLVIDTSFTTVSYDQSGIVRYYSSANGYRYARSDSTDQTNVFSGGSTSASKPQVKLTFNASDTTAPTITSVSSEKSNGYYKAGDTVDIVVTFSEAVTGNVTVTLETGETDRTCTMSLSNETSGTCQYTVQAQDISADLEATISATSGNIVDQASNILVNFTPTTSLATNKNIAIDTTTPTLTLTATSTTSNTATISWTTNEITSSKINFGITGSYGTSTRETNTSPRVTDHTVTISNITPCTKYYFEAQSFDSANNSATTSGTFLTSGCTGNSSITSTDINTILSSTGGTINYSDLTLIMPTNFVTSTSSAIFQIHQINKDTFFGTVSAPTGKLRSQSEVFTLKAFSDATTTLSAFSSPLQVTLAYTAQDIVGIEETTLKIYRYDGSSWHELSNCSVNTTTKTVTCNTSAFSDFAIFGDEVVVPASTPVPSSAPVSNSNSGSGSGGNTIQSRVENLIAMGNISEANKLKQQWPHLYPQTFEINKNISSSSTILSINATSTTVLVISNPSVSTSSQPAKIIPTSFAGKFERNLDRDDEGEDVKILQKFIIEQNVGPSARELSRVGATGYFGNYTKNALGEFQKFIGIRPWVGFFGPITREYVQSKLR